MSDRKSINPIMREEVKTRDHDACRKCGHDQELHLHHIHPVQFGGLNEVDNLITLCGGCHREWEMLARPKDLTFEQWLDLPPASTLLAIFANSSKWPDELTAKEARDLILSTHQILRDIPRGH